MENSNEKVVAVGFVTLSALVGFAVATVMSALAAAWGAFNKIYSQDLVRHGVPVLTGIALFIYLYTNRQAREWGEDVVSEISKIVWPARKDVTSLTIFVTVIILIAGFAFGLIDYLSTHLVNFVLNIGA